MSRCSVLVENSELVTSSQQERISLSTSQPLKERPHRCMNRFVSQDFPSCSTDKKTCHGNRVQWSAELRKNAGRLVRNASGKALSIHTSWLTSGNTAVGVQTDRLTDPFVSENKSWCEWVEFVDVSSTNSKEMPQKQFSEQQERNADLFGFYWKRLICLIWHLWHALCRQNKILIKILQPHMSSVKPGNTLVWSWND